MINFLLAGFTVSNAHGSAHFLLHYAFFRKLFRSHYLHVNLFFINILSCAYMISHIGWPIENLLAQFFLFQIIISITLNQTHRVYLLWQNFGGNFYPLIFMDWHKIPETSDNFLLPKTPASDASFLIGFSIVLFYYALILLH